MRLYPPAYGLGREAINDFEIGGYQIRAGTQVFMFQWATQRDPRFYDDPLEFKPERWTDEFNARYERLRRADVFLDERDAVDRVLESGAFKVAFEKYFLWKMRNGYVKLP